MSNSLVFVSVILAAILVEGLILVFVRKRAYPFKESLSSFGVYLGQKASNTVGMLVLVPIMGLVYEYRLFTMQVDTLVELVVFFLLVEFAYYWQHRLSHEVRWWWTSHSVHHSSTRLTLSAAYRLGWTGWLTGLQVFYVPLVFVGYPSKAVLMMFAAGLVYQFWLHTELIPKLGWFELVFNTPSHHRVHHATNAPYIDKNYGGVLIVFDRLFGTFAEEREQCRFGLVGKKSTHHVFEIALGEIRDLLRDASHARTWRERMRYVFGPPGWTPGLKPKFTFSPESQATEQTAQSSGLKIQKG